MKFLTRLFVTLVLLSLQLNAQEEKQPEPGSRVAIWRCVSPGGTYTVALRSMTSVSIQEYIVDGTAQVNEVTIDTNGNCLARFYYIAPVTPQTPSGIGQSTIDKAQELLQEATERTGQDAVWKKVLKNYPTTTHAHTIEYRVDSMATLQKIFTSADNAFRNFRPDTVKVQ